jgi:hypothetical protein
MLPPAPPVAPQGALHSGPAGHGGRAAPSGDDWISPFEDELDVPTFLRRRGAEEDEEERDRPAFLRRSAD